MKYSMNMVSIQYEIGMKYNMNPDMNKMQEHTQRVYTRVIWKGFKYDGKVSHAHQKSQRTQ